MRAPCRHGKQIIAERQPLELSGGEYGIVYVGKFVCVFVFVLIVHITTHTFIYL